MRRAHQWMRFYCDLWSKERLKELLLQMGRRFVNNHYRRRLGLVSCGSAAVGVNSPTTPSGVQSTCSDDEADHGDTAAVVEASDDQRPLVHHVITDEVMRSHIRD